MSIKYVEGDIFDSKAEALVNPVNCVGVMGQGLALQFKRRFPKNFHAYRQMCNRQELVPGGVFLFETQGESPRYIINLATKDHWKEPSYLPYIRTGLFRLLVLSNLWGIHSIAIPPLGCGLGGLDWEYVKLLIENTFSDSVVVEAFVYEPRS